MFPPGLARLATNPCSTASSTAPMTMGIVLVACFAARTPGGVMVTITSTFSRTSSAASSGSRSALPSADRYSREMFRPSIGLSDDERIKAYATITIDDCFVIQGFRLTYSQKKGYFLFMPGKKNADGTYVDIVHPLNNETRQMIQDKVVAEYEKIIEERG
jgi:stage V sporulation protein G